MSKEIDVITHNGSFDSSIMPPVMHDIARELADERGFEMAEATDNYMNRWMREIFHNSKFNIGSISVNGNRGTIYERARVEDAIEQDYGEIISRYAPLIVGWSRWVMDLTADIPGAEAFFFPRDGYLPMYAYQTMKQARGMRPHVPELHLSRVGLGVKDETDPASGTHIHKGPDHYERLIKYWEQTAIKGGKGGNPAIFLDSLPYGYMMELLVRGQEGIIYKMGNVGKSWKEKTIPSQMLKGLTTHYGMDVVPASLYSSTWGQSYKGTQLWGVPGFLNTLLFQQGIDIKGQPDDLIAAVADGVETIFDPHDTVTDFEETESGIVKPVFKPIESKLAMRLAAKAADVIRNKTGEMIRNPQFGLAKPKANPAFYEYVTQELFKIMNDVDAAIKTGWGNGMLPGPVAALSDETSFYEQVLELQQNHGGMFPAVEKYKDQLTRIN